MHVLIIGRGKPTSSNPTIGIFEYEQAKALSKKVDQVSYFAIDIRSLRRRRPLGVYSGADGNLNWYVISLPVGAIPIWIRDWVILFSIIILYCIFLRREKPDIVHSHFIENAFAAALFCKLFSLKLVLTEHSSSMNSDAISKHDTFVAKFAYKNADKVIAVSQALASNIYERIGVKPIVIPNMFSLEFESYDKLDHAGFGFLFIGNLIDNKHPLEILKAFNLLKQNHSDIYLGIVGDGYLLPNIKAYIEQNNLNDEVTVYGKQTTHAIISILRKHDCLVLFSDKETFGVVCIEAMSQGIPVLSSASGGPNDVVNPNVGVLIPVGDYNSLYISMETMIRSNRFDSNQIREYAISHYGPDGVTNRLIKEYSILCEDYESSRYNENNYIR